MQLKLIAIKKTPNSTISTLLINEEFFCYVLEDVDRGLTQTMSLVDILAKKVPGQTAIPEGTYDVTIDFSNRFQCDMPLIENVPGYQGIRIHSGNYPKDTEGCLLVGNDVAPDMVLNSRVAFAAFFPKLKAALQNEKVTLQIIRTIA